MGLDALQRNTEGSFNTAIGQSAMQFNTVGDSNTGVGFSALSGGSGTKNTAIGDSALLSVGSGSNNTAVGSAALSGVSSGGNNIGLGVGAGRSVTTGSNNIDIGHEGVAGDSGKIRIGTVGTQTATLIAGIFNVNEGGTIKPVYINSNGRLGTQPPASARKFKEEIRPMEKTSEAILKLKPVSFRYKVDEERTRQFGLIAEEVAKVNPDLVVRDEDGKIYTVRYEAVNAMLLNEFLKEHRKVEQMQKQIETLTEGLQKVSVQLELSKSAPQTVLNNR
jgi:hypothetical protein